MIGALMSAGADTTMLLDRPAADRARRVLVVRVLEGPEAGRETTLAAGRGVVGRAAGADIHVADETVSQFHVELSTDGDEVAVTDLASLNGTRVDVPGLERDRPSLRLDRGRVPSGTVLVLGSTRLSVTAGEAVATERSTATSFGALVGASPMMRETYALLERLAKTHLCVLIEGATGTGKALAARALHDEGPRADEPFLTVNCAGLPPALAEGVLFGTEQDDEPRAGVFESARAGTVLLDHVDELPLAVQTKLLHALDQREVMPVGATSPRRFEARVVSIAGNLRQQVNRGAFREDLYFRLAQTRVTMPGLEEHPEDKKALAQHFLALVEPGSTNAHAFDADALDAIAARSYTGNVRELRNVVERAAAVSEGPAITVQDLAFERVLADASTAGSAPVAPELRVTAPAEQPLAAFKDAKQNVIDDFERTYLTQLLARAGKNVSRAAALAGVGRQSLRDLLKRHGLRGSDEER